MSEGLSKTNTISGLGPANVSQVTLIRDEFFHYLQVCCLSKYNFVTKLNCRLQAMNKKLLYISCMKSLYNLIPFLKVQKTPNKPYVISSGSSRTVFCSMTLPSTKPCTNNIRM